MDDPWEDLIIEQVCLCVCPLPMLGSHRPCVCSQGKQKLNKKKKAVLRKQEVCAFLCVCLLMFLSDDQYRRENANKRRKRKKKQRESKHEKVTTLPLPFSPS